MTFLLSCVDIVNISEFFGDSMHLNFKGSEVFTEYFNLEVISNTEDIH